MPLPLHWTGEVPPAHQTIFQRAHLEDDFLRRACFRVYPEAEAAAAPQQVTLSPLARGGAMAVYQLAVAFPDRPPAYLVGKIPHTRQIVYASGTPHQKATEATRALLQRLVELADRLAHAAPGLFPRCGGLWQATPTNGPAPALLLEEFIPGLSVEGWKHRYEAQLAAGELDTRTYQQRRAAVERLAVAAYLRLWDALDRRTFTTDPSPWNVLVRPAVASRLPSRTVTIIDLHSVEDDVTLADVIQRLGALYGLRQEVLEQVILPGILDAFGADTGRALLQAERPRLEAQARQMRQNLGVDLQGPLLQAIRRLG